jgi:murein DD-endopeptidase MepM/ murein hydrolase activator NlpD
MSPEATRVGKKRQEYNIVMVPLGEGGKTRGFRATSLKLFLIGVGMCVAIVGLTLAALVYTPLAVYVPIPNPALEQKYGREIVQTQEQLRALAEDVLLLRDYNLQLRKALGEQSGVDTSTVRSVPPSLLIVQGDRLQADTGMGSRDEFSTPEGTGQYGDNGFTSAPYNAVVTSIEGFRAAFPLIAPASGFLTQQFDPSRKHFGIDFAARRGAPVYAASDGHVVFSGWTYDDGNMIIISHGGGYLTVYKHNQSLLKNAQTFVRRGEPVALVGSSGKTSLGPHLHFELWKDGVPQDPEEFLLNVQKTQ